MNSKKNLLAATVAFFMGSGAGGVMAQETTGGEEMDWLLEEVVVTAQKRGEQSLQNVPISMSVLGGDSLDSGSLSVLDALSQVPAVSLFSGFQGGGIKVSIRGVGAGGPLFSGSSTVGYYLDDVPFGFVRSSISPDANAYDLDRVEALRGPQGTLYGASALNGVVRVLTKDADVDEFEFKARTSMSSTDGGGDNYRGDFAVNAPLIPGKLGARLVVGKNDKSGWIEKPNAIDGNFDDVNDADEQSIRLKIKATPTDELSIGFTAWRSRSDYGAPSVAGDDGINTGAFNEPNVSDYDVLGLTVQYDFSTFSISSSTSHIDFINDGVLDINNAVELITNLEAEVFTQELGLYSVGDGAWQWSLGGFYRDGLDHTTQGTPAQFAARGNQDIDYTSESFAIFGEVTRSFLDGQLDVTAGLRYFEDDVSISQNIRRFDVPDKSSTFDTVTPRAVLTWYPNDELTVYTSYSEGFRSGYDQTPRVEFLAPGFPPVEEDSLRNYEVGAKGNLLDGRLIFDAALYFIDWQDVQQTILVPAPSSVTGSVTAAVNGVSASGVGVDLALTAQPTERLQLGLNFSWNDLTQDEAVIVPGDVTMFEKGDRLNESVEYTAGLTVDYSIPLGKNGLEGQLSASANYHSAMDNRSIVGGVLFLDEGDNIFTSRLSFAVHSPEHWVATLYGDNLNNEDGTVRPSRSINRPFWDSRIRPRTIGLQVEYQY